MSSEHPRKRLLSFGRVAAALSVLGLAVLCFVVGAAAVFFRLPPGEYLSKAFAGARAWWNAPRIVPGEPNHDLDRAWVTIDRQEATCDGFTLVTTNQTPEAALIDMRGRVVHRWRMPGARPWPPVEGVRDPLPGERVHWERCHLFPNGDLLALCCNNSSIPYGYGLVKLDKDSQVLWGFSANVHHDFDVSEDGCIYLLTDRIEEAAKGEGGVVAPRCFAEDLVVLSAEGKETDRVSILDAFRESPYSLTLPSFTPSHPTLPKGHAGPGAETPLDLLHANSVKVLSRESGKRFPLFKPGQVLLSLRSPNALAVLDVEKRSITWAAKGIWHAQHDAQFLDDGRMLLFDNLGSPRGSRVIEYDPATQAVSWWWGGEKPYLFNCQIRGASQRLANGNTLVVDSVGRDVFEVTRDKEIVWKWHFPVMSGGLDSALLNVTGARRFLSHELTFMKEGTHARAN